jgi:hypothetical protein
MIKRLDEEQSDKGAEKCHTYMSVRYFVYIVENISRTTADPEWTRVSFRAIGATESYVC